VPNQKKERSNKLEVRDARVEAESCVDAALGEEFVERNECAVEEEVFESKDRARTTLFFLLFFFFLLLCLCNGKFSCVLHPRLSLFSFYFYSHLSLFFSFSSILIFLSSRIKTHSSEIILSPSSFSLFF